MTTFTVAANEQKTIVLDQAGEYEVVLAGEGAHVNVEGRFRASNAQNLIVSVILRHQAAHTRAVTTLKGVVSDSAFLQFTGRIIIEENCGDSNSFLTERILLLSEKARAEAIPDLEIKSSDVKCSHAASISSIPKDQLFYLQSRGIAETDAQQLIIEGFLA